MSEPESESESESKSEPESESVTEPVIIIGIRLNSDKAKKNYIVGDELDVTGLILEVSWSDGSEEKIDVTKDMVTGFDSKTVGKQTLTVTYKDWAGVYEVEVNAEGNKNGAVIPTTAPKDGSIEDELIVNETYNLAMFNNTIEEQIEIKKEYGVSEMKKNLRTIITAAVSAVMIAGILITLCPQISRADHTEKIGIIGAMPEEVDPLKEAAAISDVTEIAGMEFCEGSLGDSEVVIVQCGMGKVNAGVCAQTLIRDYNCTQIINTGVAGSLDNTLDIGDIVVSVDAVQHDFDVEAIGFAKGEIPYTGLYAFPADEELRASAVQAAQESVPDVHVFEGRICSGDQFISTKEQKETIESAFDGMCCEMEGAAIAQVCYLNDTPFVIIRAISDKEDGSNSVEFETFKKEAAVNCVKIVEYMITGSPD